MRALPCYLIACLWLPCAAWSFDGHQVTSGDLTALIAEVPLVTQRSATVAVEVVLSNAGQEPVSGTVAIRDMVAGSRVVGSAQSTFVVGPGRKQTLSFAITFDAAAYSAMYPVHAFVDFRQGRQRASAHAVRIVTTRFTEGEAALDPTPLQALTVPERGALPLVPLRGYRMAWKANDGPTYHHRVGWSGSDTVSHAVLGMGDVACGEVLPTITLHPPWTPIGSVFCDYRLRLPTTRPLRLTFANAIRETGPTEPPSDGVSFRVWASRDMSGTGGRLLFERFTDAKRWVAGEADLSEFAGQEIILRLESHPGPANIPYCDLSYWGDPVVISGETPGDTGPSFAQRAALNVSLGNDIVSGRRKADGRASFLVGAGGSRTAVVLRPGARGILDGALSFVGASAAVSFDGFQVDLMGQPAARWPSSVEFLRYEVRRENGRAVHAHHLRREGRRVDLKVTLWAEGDGLRMAFACTDRITDLCLRAADDKADAVYHGHGYRIVQPGAFVAYFGGHDLSTSHVGCDFAGGMSLLQAVDLPPDRFEVNPEAKRYSLHTHLNATLTFVPGQAGALDCAIRYRPLYDRRAAGGVRRLAGRFHFDVWGGRYADIADRMKEMAEYGLTDAVVTVHDWQRWGYDYRLPDIWPPNPDKGTVEDLRRLGDICRRHDIPWGLHDDYVCIFPDATGYDFDLVGFTEDGQPQMNWYTASRDAQSWTFRPDKIMPFVKRNLALIKAGVAPTHCFLDVFTSAGLADFYDREGRWHPSTETRRCWGEAFAYIRNTLGRNAPTTSEAGHDGLIGYLDGADCQHLRLTDTPQEMTLPRLCADWERVPWFDVVNHQRFVQNGVGYSDRYQGGRTRRDHGITSDDYLSDEILLGHSLAVDQGCWGAAAVRKYWLAQPVARNLALRAITEVQMAGGDMHRQTVTWDNGTRVSVNRGAGDWQVGGRRLPQYGYLVMGKGLMSTIEERDGVVCESSVGPDGWYCNARTWDPERPLRIAPRIEGFRYLGGRQFRYDMVWQADEPAPRDMTVYVHFYRKGAPADRTIAFQDDHRPDLPTSQWRGEVRYTRTNTVPEDAGGEYVIGWGIYDAGGILGLTGPAPQPATGTPVWVGNLQVTRGGGAVADIALSPPPAYTPPPERGNPDDKPIDFGFAAANGGFRIQRTATGLRLTPLPGHPPFDAVLRLGRLGLSARAVSRVTSAPGAAAVPCTQRGGTLRFRHDGVARNYDIVLQN